MPGNDIFFIRLCKNDKYAADYFPARPLLYPGRRATLAPAVKPLGLICFKTVTAP